MLPTIPLGLCRGVIDFVLLNIVLAYGVVWALESYRLLEPLFAVLLFSSLASFCYIFYFVTPVTNANDYFFGDRLVANYIRLSDKSRKILIIDWQPRYIYSAIVLAHGNIDQTFINTFDHHYSPSDDDTYQVGNLTITHTCPKTGTYDTIITRWDIVASLPNCPIAVSLMHQIPAPVIHSLVSPLDSHEERRIIGDTLCTTSELGTYVHPTSLADFRLESMGRGEFCSKWVVAQ